MTIQTSKKLKIPFDDFKQIAMEELRKRYTLPSDASFKFMNDSHGYSPDQESYVLPDYVEVEIL